MFDKILIANRGEIACRVIRTARAMGVQTVAVYSDADVDSLHVRQADEAIRLGPAPVAESYLRGELIISAAKATGAQAIHPGYGFLSENPDFVDQVEAEGLRFIGPSAEAIRAMGLKDTAKALMAKAGVPVVPGHQGPEQTPAFLAKKAEELGFPVLIKAVAGGGGKGMRLVEEPKNFLENFSSAQAEAQAAFGNPDVLIEKFILSPRHIEVQVFGDGKNVVHLFERDCSLQRRHQKVIEEAPAPGMTDAMRAAMGKAAMRAAQAIGYAGAGTVEFIADGTGELRPDGFWFMEMNTRLQVEHPVTEAITGVDLVEWQLRVAAGEPLPVHQKDLSIRGHAFEARLYAEDVAAGFLPATGRVDHLVFAGDARIDSGVAVGSEISPWYDPMIAKITTHGPDRMSALQGLSAALDATEVAGIVTNLGFLRRLSRDPGFREGQVDTGLIARGADRLCAVRAPSIFETAVAFAIAAGIDEGPLVGFHLWTPLVHEVMLRYRGTDIVAFLTVINDRQIRARIDGTDVTLTRRGGHWGLPGLRNRNQVTVFASEPYLFDIVDPYDRQTEISGGDTVFAPMPGLVTTVAAQASQTVRQGDRLIVLEAMKMEHTLRAPRDGTIAAVAVCEGDQVTAGTPLISLEEEKK